MGRPATKPARLKDGFYIEVKTLGSGSIFIRRDTKEQMIIAAEDYSRTKQVIILGEMKNDKWLWIGLIIFLFLNSLKSIDCTF